MAQSEGWHLPFGRDVRYNYSIKNVTVRIFSELLHKNIFGKGNGYEIYRYDNTLWGGGSGACHIFRGDGNCESVRREDKGKI